MKSVTRIVIAVALFTLLPAALLAQEEVISLETLANATETLTERINGLQERIEVIEALFTGPGAVELDDGSCQIAGDGFVQNETAMKYKDWAGEWPPVDQMRVFSIALQEDGNTRIVFAFSFTDERVEELWNGCDFVSSGDWYRVDWEGNRIEE